MLAPDSSPVTVSYHLYSVSSGRCRVTILGRYLEEGPDGLCIRCRFIRAKGKIQRTHARVPLAHYIKRLTKKLLELAPRACRRLWRLTKGKMAISRQSLSHAEQLKQDKREVWVRVSTRPSWFARSLSSPSASQLSRYIRGESWEVTQAPYLGAILAGQHFLWFIFAPEPDSKNWFHGRIKCLYLTNISILMTDIKKSGDII